MYLFISDLARVLYFNSLFTLVFRHSSRTKGLHNTIQKY